MTHVLLSGAQPPDGFGPDYLLAPEAALLIAPHGNGFVFDMRESFYAVSAVGGLMLERTLRAGEADAAATVARDYAADPDQIATDLRGFLDNWEQKGVIVRRGSSSPAPTRSIRARSLARMAAATFALPMTMRVMALLTLARLSFALAGWSATLSAWRGAIGALPLARQPSTIAAIDDAVRTISARMPLGGNCKERALASFALSRQSGIASAVVVGVVDCPLGGHTWCEAQDGTVIGDFDEHCARCVPIFRYG